MWQSGSPGEEEHFEEPKILAQSEEAHWNPVLFRVMKRRSSFLQSRKEISKWRTMYRVSEDNGETFGEEKELVPGDQGGRGPVRNKPIRLKSGRILAPGSTEQGFGKHLWIVPMMMEKHGINHRKLKSVSWSIRVESEQSEKMTVPFR